MIQYKTVKEEDDIPFFMTSVKLQWRENLGYMGKTKIDKAVAVKERIKGNFFNSQQNKLQ